MRKKICIIDDDEKLQRLLKEYLEEYSYKIMSLLRGDRVIEFINMEKPDIIILDIMLPGKDGMEILKDIRKSFGLPVIMLTAKGEETDRIVGLELGADDYLSKPFNPRELLARIKAVLRRSDINSVEIMHQQVSSIKKGGLTLNNSSMTLEIGDKSIELSRTEYKILEAFMKNPGIVISRDELMNIARGRDFIAFERSIDVHVSKLRAKIESISGVKKKIKTIWGTGYMFVDN
jgi:two-component system, OmpR family, phosphate regulon response regulator OmpR